MAIRYILRRSTSVSLLAEFVYAAAAHPDEPKAADPSADRSVVLNTVKMSDRRVENGSAYDTAVLDLGRRKKLVVPNTAEVYRGGEGTKVQIYLKKTLGFGGHPPEPMSIRTARKYMGCATREEETTLILGTFGEWKSKEGGARIKMVVIVPVGIEVKKRAGLSGSDSDAKPAVHEAYLTKSKEVKDGYWFGPATAAEGWTVVRAEPDYQHRADKPVAGPPLAEALAVCGGLAAAVPWPQQPTMR